MKNRLFIFILVFLFITKASISFFAYKNTKNSSFPTKEVIASLTKTERLFLEHFFQALFLQENGYALFGEKPSSFTAYSFPFNPVIIETDTYRKKFFYTNFKVFNSLNYFDSYLMIKGWKTWKKVEKKLPLKKFLILKFHSELDNVEGIITINKKNFIKTVNENNKYFSQLFGYPITGKRLLMKFNDNPLVFWEKIKENNHECIGILLGFGKQNSHLFQQRENIRLELMKTLYKKNSSQYQKLVEEYDKYRKILKPSFNRKHSRLSICNLPGFLVDPTTEETHQLKKKYREEQLEIINELKKHNFLEKILEKLAN